MRLYVTFFVASFVALLTAFSWSLMTLVSLKGDDSVLWRRKIQKPAQKYEKIWMSFKWNWSVSNPFLPRLCFTSFFLATSYFYCPSTSVLSTDKFSTAVVDSGRANEECWDKLFLRFSSYGCPSALRNFNSHHSENIYQYGTVGFVWEWQIDLEMMSNGNIILYAHDGPLNSRSSQGFVIE